MSANLDMSAYEVKDPIDVDPEAAAKIDIKFFAQDVEQLHAKGANSKIRRAVYECIKKYLRTVLNDDTSEPSTKSKTNKKDLLSQAIDALNEKEIHVVSETRVTGNSTLDVTQNYTNNNKNNNDSNNNSKDENKENKNNDKTDDKKQNNNIIVHSRIHIHCTISCKEIYREFYINAWQECIKNKKFSSRLLRNLKMEKKESHRLLFTAMKVTYSNRNTIDRDIEKVEMIPFSKSTSGSWAQYQNYLKRKKHLQEQDKENDTNDTNDTKNKDENNKQDKDEKINNNDESNNNTDKTNVDNNENDKSDKND